MMDEINRLGSYEPLLPWKHSMTDEVNRLGPYIHKLEADDKERDLALAMIDNLRALADIATEIATPDKLEAEGAEVAAKLATIDKLKAETVIQLDIIDKLRGIEEIQAIGEVISHMSRDTFSDFVDFVDSKAANSAFLSSKTSKTAELVVRLKAEHAARAEKEANALRAYEGTTVCELVVRRKAENAARAEKEANALRAGEGRTGWKKNLLVFLDRYSDRLLLVLLLVLLFFFAFILGNLTAMGGLTMME